jgi:hypothetical protein
VTLLARRIELSESFNKYNHTALYQLHAHMQIECNVTHPGSVTLCPQTRTNANNKQSDSCSASKGSVDNGNKQHFVFTSKLILHLTMQGTFTIGKQILERMGTCEHVEKI